MQTWNLFARVLHDTRNHVDTLVQRLPRPLRWHQRNTGDATAASRLYDGVVNQLLAKMDGLTEMNNVLVIGLTNRWQVIDAALLRPGRFEVQIQIGYVTVQRQRVCRSCALGVVSVLKRVVVVSSRLCDVLTLPPGIQIAKAGAKSSRSTRGT